MIKTLQLKNWKTHEDTELDFTKGTNVIIGEMGTGKTSTLEAISYALFGTYPSLSSRETTLDQTIRNTPHEKDKAEVKLTFKVNGENYTVKRTIEKGKGTTESELRKNDELIESPSTVKVTNAVQRILKMNYDLFSKAVYTEQNRMDYFLEISKGERKEKIDQLLELHRWEESRKKLTRTINILREKAASEKERSKETPEIQEIPAIKKGLEKIQEKIQEDKKELVKTEEKLEQKKKEYKETREKAEKHGELSKKVERNQERVKYLEKDLKDLPKAEEETQVNQRIKKLKEKKERIREKEKKLNSIKTLLKTTEERIKKLTNKKKEKEEEIEKIEVGKEVKKQLEETATKLKEIQKKISEKKAEKEKIIQALQEEAKHLQTILKEETECPTCGTSLTGGRKEKVEKEKKEKVEKIKKKKQELAKEIQELEKEEWKEEKTQERLKKQEKQLEVKTNLKKELEGLQEELKEEQDQLKKLENKKENIKITEKEEEVEKNLKHEERKKEYLKKKKEKEETQEKLIKHQEQLKEIKFNEEEFKELYEELKTLDKEGSLIKQEIHSKKQLKLEKEKNLNNLEKQKKEKEKSRKKAAYIEKQLNHLQVFKTSLRNVQSHLRERFIEETNSALNMVWNKLYPYRNYEDLRMNIDEKGDYILEVKEPSRGWINVEGRASGGERTTASLCLRISLALVLTKELSWIVLDEPTHNLDENAVSELSVALGEYLPEMVEQVFIITHESRLKEASSGTFYRFSRNKEENEPTVVDKI